MSIDNSKKEWLFLLKSAGVSILRAVIGLPYEHPLETIKTVMQNELTKGSIYNTVRFIYRERGGLAGLYSGLIPNTARIILKTAYRIPLMLKLPLAVSYLSNKILGRKISTTTEKTITGIVLAALEVLIITPTERLKVWLMTRTNNDKNIRYFLKNVHSFFRGLNIVFWRQTASWVTFLVTDDILKTIFRRSLNLYKCDMLPYWCLMTISLAVGTVNTLMILPLDFIKTHIQKDVVLNPSVRQVARQHYRIGGISIFYNSWKIKMIQYVVQSVLTVKIYDVLETQYKQAYRS